MGALSSSLLENSRCVAGSRMLRATPSPTGEEMYSSEYTPASVLSEFNKRFLGSSMVSLPLRSSISMDSGFWRSRNTQSEQLNAASIWAEP